METENRYKKEEWDDYYEREKKLHIKVKNYGLFKAYDIYLFQEILKRYIPYDPSRSIVEIGSGDGKLLKEISALIGGKVTGIEYSEPAARIAESNGVRTIVGDTFSEKLRGRYKECFDVVYSYGFVEHITPPRKAVDIHLDLVKKGGYFFVQIPRLRKFNWLRFKIFRPSLLDHHNLPLMEQEILEKECMVEGVEKVFCGAYGTFKLRLPMDQKNIRYYALKAACLLEYILNPLFRAVFGNRGFETRFFSPALIFIGRKI